MCLAMVVAVMLAGCEKNQADQKKDSVQKSSQSTEPGESGEGREGQQACKEQKGRGKAYSSRWQLGRGIAGISVQGEDQDADIG